MGYLIFICWLVKFHTSSKHYNAFGCLPELDSTSLLLKTRYRIVESWNIEELSWYSPGSFIPTG